MLTETNVGKGQKELIFHLESSLEFVEDSGANQSCGIEFQYFNIQHFIEKHVFRFD